VAPIGVEKNFERGLINYCKVYAQTLCMPVWTGASIVMKAVFESEKGFKPTLKLGEDFDLLDKDSHEISGCLVEQTVG